MTAEWDGITKSEVLRDYEIELRHNLADAAKRYDWQKTLEILNERPRLINTTRPEGKSLYTPLHQAAYGNAPVEVAQKLLEAGAWRTLRNADNARAVDIAKEKKHHHLIPLLEPVYKIYIPLETLQKIQNYFHEIILSRAGDRSAP
jgi:hypothetical protein